MLTTPSAQAAENTAPAKMSLMGAMAAALDTNANIKEASENRKSALSELRIAAFNTSYGLGSSTSLQHNSDNSGLAGRLFSNATYEALGGATASLDLAPLGIGGQRGSIGIELRRPMMSGSGLLSTKSNKLLSARSNASVKDGRLYLMRQSTASDVIQSYYRAVLAREQVKVKQHAVEIAESALVGAQEREKEGLSPGMDVSRAELQVAQTKDSLNSQKRVEREALDKLMLAIGKGVGETPELTDPLPEAIPETPGLGKAVERALNNRYELQVNDTQIADSERNLALKTDLLRPRLDAVAGFDSTNGDNGLLSRSVLRSGAFNVGFEMVFPLDKRINLEERDTAARALDVLRALRSYEMEQITEQVQNAYRRVESARASMNILNENYKIAKKNLELNQDALDEGIANNRDLLDAQNSLIRAEGDLLSTRTDLYLASINLKYYIGEDLTDMGSK